MTDWFSHWDFTNLKIDDAGDFINNLIIRGSCFSQQQPDTKVFPDEMTGVTFVNCNLDNVAIPDGNTLIDCSNRRYVVQNDMNDWEIDENNNPVRLVNWLYFDKFDLPQPTPDMIPNEPVSEAVDYRRTD